MSIGIEAYMGRVSSREGQCIADVGLHTPDSPLMQLMNQYIMQEGEIFTFVHNSNSMVTYMSSDARATSIRAEMARRFVPGAVYLTASKSCMEVAVQAVSDAETLLFAKLLQYTMCTHAKENMLALGRDEISNATIMALQKRSAELGYPVFKFLVNRLVVAQLNLIPHPSIKGHFALRDDPYVDIGLFKCDASLLIISVPDEPIGIRGLRTQASTPLSYITQERVFQLNVETSLSITNIEHCVGVFDAPQLFEDSL